LQAPAGPVPEWKRRLWAALGLVILFVAGMTASVGPGITWDEPAYVSAGYRYCEWFGSPSLGRAGIDKYWDWNHEHPPAAKIVYGLAAQIGERLGFDGFFAARVAGVLMFVALAWLVYWFASRHFGRAAGTIAALSLALSPRVFGHGHLAALDMPVALACFAATAAFSRAHTGKWKAAAAGILCGVALLTKINAVFLPAVLIPWALWYHRKRAILPCVLLIVLGCLTFFAGWPWLWHDTWSRVGQYTINKTERFEKDDRAGGTTNVPVHYLGTTYRYDRAPWHYPFVMTLVTVPAGLLVFAGIGVRKARGGSGERGTGVLILASALLHLLVFALPVVPKYDGVRLFMPAFPFIACLAGIGGACVWQWRERAGKVIVVAVLGIAAAALFWTHPYELSYYNALTGGAWGARKLGFETTYWGDTVNLDVMAYVNEHCPDGSTISVRPPYFDFMGGVPGMKRALQLLKGWKPQRPPDFLIVFPRQGHLDDFTVDLIRTREPARQWTYMGVPQCMLFDLRRRK